VSAVAVSARHESTKEPTRARHPDETGFAEREGVRLFYEVYGNGELTFLFVNPGPFVHSRLWKAQIPYLARHFRVVAFDVRGSGRSDRPTGVDAYRTDQLGRDALAVLDATGTAQALPVTVSAGSRATLWLLANHPDRFAAATFIGPYLPITRWQPVETMWRTFTEPRASRRAARMVADTIAALPRSLRSPTYRRFARRVRFLEGLEKWNRDYWLVDQRGFVEWNFETLDFVEPHSTRQIEDSIEWGMSPDPQTMVDWWLAMDIVDGALLRNRDEILAACRRVRCPVLVIQGELDLATPPEWGRALAEATAGRYVEIAATGHVPQARRPVVVNIALREFAESL
jgi:pimeloyl-ACP methyl ester carboxylesterase